MSKGLICALMVIAGAVFVAQVARSVWAWPLICLYWGTLTVKNFIDWRRK